PYIAAFFFPSMTAMSVMGGITPVSQFPNDKDAGGSTEWILVRYEQGTVFTRPSPYIVNFDNGRILVSVKKPSNMAFVKVGFGEIALQANGDMVVSNKDGVLRIDNLDGIGKSVTVRLNEGPFGGKAQTLSIAPGYEVVAGEHKLTAHDLHPHDGIARRNFRVLQSGNLAVSEFSVESAIKNISMIVEMTQSTSGVKERRIAGDMSKMAAVLNYMNGTQGYTEEK
ncbi:MAG: hypothetical protein ACRD3W_29750, partial [Terriglobales bacterium]